MGNLSHIKIEGFKSIKKLDLEMKPINVLIGANGSGKSNFISSLLLLKYIDPRELRIYMAQKGGADSFLHFGSKVTDGISINTTYDSDYNINTIFFKDDKDDEFLRVDGRPKKVALEEFIKFLDGLMVYHFQDTSSTAKFKSHQKIFDYDFLRSDAKNIAPFLYRLKNEFNPDYQQIVQAIQTVAPYFYDFVLEPVGSENEESILLRWQHKNDLDNVFSASQLSDGTARFICMAVLFLQPKRLRPKTIVLDEPEIGLHPTAIAVLSEIIQAVANDGSQVIISTQSVELANYFEPDDFIVVDYENGESKFKRLNVEDLGDWIETYQVGEAWSEGLLGGEPKW